jgi:hypothetical protein
MIILEASREFSDNQVHNYIIVPIVHLVITCILTFFDLKNECLLFPFPIFLINGHFKLIRSYKDIL